MSDQLDRAVTQINQSVDEKLETGLTAIQQRLEQRLESSQRLKTPSKGNEKATPNLAETSKGKGKAPPSPAETEHSSLVWADRMSEEDGEVSGDEDLIPPPAKKTKLELSEETKKLVKKSFSIPLSNPERRETKCRAPPLDLPETRCPRLDPLFKTGESKFGGNSEAKQVDNDLQKVQALMLDVAAPLLQLRSCVELGEEQSLPRDPAEMVDDALKLLGNAISSTSKIRRKRVLKACNPDIQDLAEEESLFQEAGPNLFGQDFEKKMKERAEAVKILSKSQGPKSRKFFRGGRHSQAQRGGGSSFRGGRVQYPQGYHNPFGYRGGYQSYSHAARTGAPKKNKQ